MNNDITLAASGTLRFGYNKYRASKLVIVNISAEITKVVIP